ncbi:MAG TPA: type-F conjugative transfer system secretin TraK, partial [Gammaproteobacteria bacterium]|nr:type-F conjugative transfer system secretin TraK [Gammaproteobacteria bacterium]
MKKSISQNIGRNLSVAFLLSNMCMDLSRAETYFVEDNVRVIAPIALDALNRIKVVDDRIAQIFGNEDAFSLETDEQSGQIFIKPHNDILFMISLVTEKE